MSSTSPSKQRATPASALLLQVKRRVRTLVKGGTWIPLGAVRWGDLRRREPICANFGYGRGKPIDRFYIERFIGEHAEDVRGRVLEIKDAGYTRKFGGSRVIHSDVLDINPRNSAATIVGDLSDPSLLSRDTYDCVIVTQTLQYLFDPAVALENLQRSLKPGGVILLTVPGITPIRDAGAPWYWNFLDAGVERLLREQGFAAFEVAPRGNLATVTAFLHGLCAAELEEEELAASDPAYQLLVVARALKDLQ